MLYKKSWGINNFSIASFPKNVKILVLAVLHMPVTERVSDVVVPVPVALQDMAELTR